MTLFRLFALASFLFISSISLFAQIDTSFGSNGIASTQFPPLNSQSEQILVLPDGKILTAGRAYGSGTYGNAVLIKFLANGQLDTSFGIGGRSVLSELKSVNSISALELAADGKILVMGNYRVTPNIDIFNSFIARFTADGEEDTSFGTSGKIIINRDDRDENYDLEPSPDGKFYVGGVIRRPNFQPYGYAARYNSNGSPDNTFANGLFLVPMPNNPDYLFSAVTTIEALSANEIFIGTHWIAPGNQFLWMTKLNAQGGPITSFGSNGVSSRFGLLLPGQLAGYSKYAFLPNGKIAASIWAGYALFSANGIFELSKNSPSISSEVSGIAASPSGEIILRDRYSQFRNPNPGQAIFRFNHSNNLIGYIRYDFDYLETHVPFAPLPNGRVLIGGSSGLNYSIARYLNFSLVSQNRDADFDGDGKTDFAVCRGGVTRPLCYLYRASGPFEITPNFGGAVIAEDFSGDARADVTQWFQAANGLATFTAYGFTPQSEPPNILASVFWGNLNSDTAIGGDYDGNERSDYAVFRNGLWGILFNQGGTNLGYQWGLAGDKPVARDYDGDRKADIAIYRPSTGQWAILRSSDGVPVVTQFGIAEDKPVPGDYDGDGKNDIAVYRPSLGTWFINGSATGFRAIQFGIASDRPVPGDYDGDGKMDAAVFRNGAWYVNGSLSGFIYTQWGTTGDKPLTTAYSAQ